MSICRLSISSGRFAAGEDPPDCSHLTTGLHSHHRWNAIQEKRYTFSLLITDHYREDPW
jgi:hypothetical protein